MKYMLVEGDSRNMWEIPDESIDLIFTSPPYFDVKQYDNNPKNIGNSEFFDDYLKSLRKVFEECVRVLNGGCFLIVNISDIRSNTVRYNIPSYVSVMLKELGLEYKEDIIWEKNINTSDKRFGVFIQNPKPRYFYPNNVYEHTFIYLKGSDVKRTFSDEVIDAKKLLDNGFERDVWRIQPETLISQIHEAPFPLEYAKLIVGLYSCKGETVLDPFMGSGTVFVACKELRRNAIGYEINVDYVKLISERMQLIQQGLTDNDEFIVKKQTPLTSSIGVMGTQKCDKCGADAIVTTTRSFITIECEKCGNYNRTIKSLFNVQRSLV